EDVATAPAPSRQYAERSRQWYSSRQDAEGNRQSPPTPNLLPEIGAALAGALRPLVVTGSTFTRSREREALLQFVSRQGMPFISTLHGKGFLPESHRNWVGVLGRARRSDVQRFVDRADLIIAVGYDPIEINYEEWTGNT